MVTQPMERNVSTPDGPEEREADRLERDTYDHDAAAAHADEQQACDCDEGRMCDTHFQQALAEHAYLRHVPRHQVFGDAQAQEERDQELIDAGRGGAAYLAHWLDRVQS
jgi:hypothetical protein